MRIPEQTPSLVAVALSLALAACASTPPQANTECMRFRIPAEFNADGKLAGSTDTPGARNQAGAQQSTDQILEVNCEDPLADTSGEPKPR